MPKNCLDKTYQQIKLQNDITSELIREVTGQKQLLLDMGNIVNLQSRLLNELNQQIQTLLYKVSDIEIRNNIIDDGIRDLQDNTQQLNSQIDDLKNEIHNIKIYKMVQ